MSLLFLVRHGQASAGTHDYDRLSNTGRKQACMLGQWWKEHDFRPAKFFHGTLKRQRDTATSALEGMGSSAQHVECHTHDGLNEYDHRVIESHFAKSGENETPESMTFEQYLDIMSRWRDHRHNEAMLDSDKIESWQEFQERGWRTICSVHEPDRSDGQCVYFTSGGVIASIVSNVLNLDFEHTIDAIWRIRNASITTLHYDGKRARLVDFNTIPHLQTRPERSLITLI
ncbi:MAG: histidine phosphatase family protein [Granulosicoccus sp.]